ncbi:MAG: hypothetical protein CME62_16925 [Halobacteriovoraceae bacterium]|nr:hypothetical protein [Halobacteriovoraceae bacterium]|tara:strand:+ start:24114 stop:26195 length:2082 start_codon:yes stop_codon:yes gene_type:complete
MLNYNKKIAGGFLNYRNGLISILFFLSASSYAANHLIKNYALMSHSPQSRLTKTEEKIAKNFTQLLKLSHNKVINKRLMKSLAKDMNQNNIFKDYAYWPNELLQLQRLTSSSQVIQKCRSYKEDSKNLVHNYLKRNLSSVCFKNYLHLLGKEKRLSYRFHINLAQDFADHLEYLLTDSQQQELHSFLQEIESHSKLHRLYSDKIADYYTSKDLTPSPYLIRHLHLTPEFTQFIQTKEIEPNTTHSIFYRELTGNTQALRDFIDQQKKLSAKDITYITRQVKEVVSFAQKNQKYYKLEKINQALLAFGKSLNRRKLPKHARYVYRYLLSQKKTHFHTSLFEYMWTYISRKNYPKALKALDHYVPKTEEILANSKLSFWAGYLNLELGNKENALKMFKATIHENPLSYYSILAAKTISDYSQDSPEKIYLTSLRKPESNNFDSKTFDHAWLKRTTAWSAANNRTLLNLEFQQLLNEREGIDLEVHILAAANKLKKNENYLESFKFIYKTIDERKLTVNQETLKILFPSPFKSQIEKNTKEFDPVIAMALIRQESGFNKYARSHVGARGLMQLMPSTARRFKRIRTRQLYNPALNIKIGTTFFTKLLNKYDNNLVYSLAAYNAGMSRIDDWQERDYVDAQKSMLDNIENIPFLETRKYVKLIFRNMFFYKLLNPEHGVNDSEKFNKIFDIHVGFKN